MALAPEVMIRGLAFVRYLYTLGLQQSQQAGLAGAVSILTFHDAVEMLLVLGLQHHDRYSTGRQYRFHDYWTELAQAQVYVTQKGTMEALNRARVGVKHHAIPPDRSIIDAARVHVRDFFTENAPIIFGVNFEEVTLSSLVTSSSQARTHLESAEHHMAEGNCDEAMGEIAYALHRLLNAHEARVRQTTWARGGKRALRLDTVLLPRALLLPGSLGAAGVLVEQHLARFAKDVADHIRELQLALRILGLGLDFGRWQRFMTLTPAVIDLQPGQLNRTEWHGETPPTLGECRFCYDFVIDSALRLQEAE